MIAAENVDPATVRAKAGAAQLVGDRWLTDSIARNERQNAAAHAWGAVEERPEEAAPARRSDVLPKFGCQRKITKADDQNKQLTGWLKLQLESWPAWKSTSELGYCGDLREPPRHRAAAITG